jgi:invasion protein IalB
MGGARGHQFVDGARGVEGLALCAVDGARFALQTRADNAWVKNVSEEARLVDSMRHGHEAIVTGVSTRGTQTTDHYSLKGITQALERVAQECR